MKTSERGNISPFLVMEAFREAAEVEAQGKSVIHLSLGQPARKAPERVLRKVAELSTTASLGYTDARGIPALRQRIAQHYGETYNIDVSPDSIFVTVGSSSAFLLAMLSAFDTGEKIAIGLPCYPAYPNMMKAMGITPVYLRTTRETNFQPNAAMLASRNEKPHGMVIASPSNPSGTIMDETVLQELVEYCDREGIRLLSDEIYHGVSYGQKTCRSTLEFSRRMIVMNSFSKYYLLPGWRLGWMVAPEELKRPLESLMQNFFISPPAIAQAAALECFSCLDELNDVVSAYARNREILLEELPKAGFRDLCPAEGAFYIYANVSELTNDSREFCRAMLHEAGVCAIPGWDFDRENGGAYVRFSFAGAEEEIREATSRLKTWLG